MLPFWFWKMLLSPGDRLQIIYRNDLSHTFQIVEENYSHQDSKFLYTESSMYKLSKIKLIRNLTEEGKITLDD